MKIAYIAAIRLPTEKADGYQIMRVCSALAALGHDVSLYVPTRINPIATDPFDFYSIERNFRVVRVPCADWIRYAALLGPLALFLQMYSFVRALRHGRYVSKGTTIYSRDPEVVASFAKAGYACVYNAHTSHKRAPFLIRRARGVVCNSAGTERLVREKTGLPTVVAHNAADCNPYVDVDKVTLRHELRLPEERPLALYAGHLYAWKGGETVLAAAALCPDVTFVVVGGTERDVQRVSEQTLPANVLLLGHQERSRIPRFLAAADVLLFPNTAGTQESISHTSPLKLFEYMAAGRPIVASDLPSVRDILSEETAFFVVPGSAVSLVRGVREALAGGTARAESALQESYRHTWEQHARTVADFIARVTSQRV